MCFDVLEALLSDDSITQAADLAIRLLYDQLHAMLVNAHLLQTAHHLSHIHVSGSSPTTPVVVLAINLIEHSNMLVTPIIEPRALRSML